MGQRADVKVVVEYDPEAPEREELRARLRVWTQEKAGHWELAQQQGSATITLRAADGRLIGGVFGDAFLGCFGVRILWVDPEYRGQGWGKELMRRVEQEARDMGCRTINLDTFDLQAPGFYMKLGFEEFGRFEFFPGGPEKVYLKKSL